jgi:asparagine synthase (glutamine-hydrolysing)
MCGIAGVFNLDPTLRVDADHVVSMCNAIARRGPNDAGYLVEDNLGIGMRRLSIIDVAGGQQPIFNEDGSQAIVFNGEIFNYRPLQDDLRRRGHQFKTRSDTETILHLFEEEGPACLRHLRGMFAFAIWNRRDRSLFIARDRLGIKPLHYLFDGRKFVFGSEIKAITSLPGVHTTTDWTALDAFFAYGFIPAPWTIHREIRKLRPGYYLQVDERGVREHQYWDVSFDRKLTAPPRDIAAEFLERFRDSVEMRMLSEVPLGAFLSGGVDSSLVVATMAQMSERPVKTFTIGFGGDTGNYLDERPYAREVSDRYGTEHREFEVQPAVEAAIDAALDAFDEPFADDSLIPTHHICELAKQHVTVALTGLGGDENFAGYERYLGFSLSTAADHSPWRELTRLATPFVRGLREPEGGGSRVNHLKRFVEASQLEPSARWQRYQAIADRHGRAAMYSPAIAREIDFAAVDLAGMAHYMDCTAADPVDRALYQDLKFYLPDDILALTDRVGMWHSLELRVPFVDHTLVEFCAQIPVSLKLKWTEKKHLLRSVAKPLLPPSILNHRKQGFASPMARWLRHSMNGYVHSLLEPRAVAAAGVLNPAIISTQLEDHQSRRALNDKKLFTALMFQRWWTTRAN